MTLLDAKQYDPTHDNRKWTIIIGSALIILILAGVAWFLRYWPEEHVANKFFSALQKQDYETAYGIWMHDPQWKEHQANYARYPYHEFYTDWGLGGEWGKINTYKIFWSGNCPKPGSGIVVDVVVNDRTQHAQVYVSKEDKMMGYVPCDIEVH
ncbi:MAG TPA: hypothetical protein VLK33_22525 [Terriglobales bacterium]|nr:hypothetical protein [Terriglobales bacterium]